MIGKPKKDIFQAILKFLLAKSLNSAQKKGWIINGVFFFFPLFKNLAEVAIIPKDGLARFGYILDMKVEKKNQNPSIDSWLLTGTYH
jgi:hypothetical protein